MGHFWTEYHLLREIHFYDMFLILILLFLEILLFFFFLESQTYCGRVLFPLFIQVRNKQTVNLAVYIGILEVELEFTLSQPKRWVVRKGR